MSETMPGHTKTHGFEPGIKHLFAHGKSSLTTGKVDIVDSWKERTKGQKKEGKEQNWSDVLCVKF